MLSESRSRRDNDLTRISDVCKTQSSFMNKSHRRYRQSFNLNQSEVTYVKKWFKENLEMFPKIDLIEPQGEMRHDIMESWLNSILEDAEMLKAPGVVLSRGNIPVLERYGVDRKSLNDVGCHKDSVDRLYRALFVYSIGFYQLIRTLVKDATNNFVLVSKIWKVYIILLEYWNKTDYKTLIEKLSNKYNKQVKDIENHFHQQFLMISNKIENHDEEIKSLEKIIHGLK